MELLPPNHSEIANALSNYALSMIGTGKGLEKALKMLLKALEIDMSNPTEDREKVLHLRHYNLCFAYRALGDFGNARDQVDKASRYVEAEFGKDSRYLSITYRILSDFMSREGNYDETYSLSEKALAIAKKDSSISPWVSASLFKLGCIRLKQKRIEEAM
ncbi:MAG: hypothetical protein M1840_004645 [Geoglossum simile]|nr:MAG: hypothetical protein M1840_004645 [Geoglossum simile]